MSFTALATADQISTVLESLNNRGIQASVVRNSAEALEKLKSLIPEGASVLTGASISLKQIGFEDFLRSGEHPWNNLKDTLLSAPREQQYDLRREGTLADFFVASVQAVTESGQVLVASATGSQIPAYAFSSPNVVWVVGVQKIVPTLDAAFERLYQHNLPIEDKRAKADGMPGSMIGKILIFEREAAFLGRNVHLILVEEELGI